MEENRIKIHSVKKEAKLLPMKGTDQEGNIYEVDNISFIKNGKRILPVAGEIQYSRYDAEDWEEELRKMKAGGVNIIATYAIWIHHEEKEGEWDFSGCRDLRAFLEICRKMEMLVWLRIGPWAHGECRNGGFPDWVAHNQGRFKVRRNDPEYLKVVRRYYQKLGEQANGMMVKDGGPILGVQLENEYGHCGGPEELAEGMAHMRMLKKLAIEAGFEVPYYTATGWGGAYVVDYEMLPVFGGYVDAPWAGHTKEMPANENFLFLPYRDDENIGSDFNGFRVGRSGFTFDIDLGPYLTVELGGGMQPTSHRRPYPYPEDTEAQALCMLGSGANMLGYYVYHGGINPDGKYSTLQESRSTGYSNDLPVKSYDFQACIRESGELAESYGRLKKIHLLLQDFGDILAGAQVYFPEIRPRSAEDLQTIRMSARVHPDTGAGFLFLNNHQRKRKMKEQNDFSVRICYEDRETVISHLYLKDGDCAIVPFAFPLGNYILEETNASLLCRLGERIFFYAGHEAPIFRWRTEEGPVTVLTVEQANRAYKYDDGLYITEFENSCILEEDGCRYLLTKAEKERIQIYDEQGTVREITLEAEPVEVSAEIISRNQVYDEDGSLKYCEYGIKIGAVPVEKIHQLYLVPEYFGDRAEVYVENRLVDDWFTTGEEWHVAMKRFGYPEVLNIRIYPSDKPLVHPYGNQVYYDLPAEKGCVLNTVRVLPEYKVYWPQ